MPSIAAIPYCAALVGLARLAASGSPLVPNDELLRVWLVDFPSDLSRPFADAGLAGAAFGAVAATGLLGGRKRAE